MNKPSLFASVLATLATTFAIGCASPTDTTDDASFEETTTVTTPASTPESNVEADVQAHEVYDFLGEPGTQLIDGKDIANIVLGRLANEGFDLLLNYVGMGGGDGQQLAHIIAQLDRIDQNITETRNALNHAIAKAAIDAKLTALFPYVDAIQRSLVRYQRIAAFEKSHALAVQSGDLDKAASLEWEIKDAVREFVVQFDSDLLDGAPGVLAKNIGGMNAGDTNIIDHYRQNLRASGRIQTHKHSESLRTGYLVFENLQSMAVMLKAECNAAMKHDKEWELAPSRNCSKAPTANQELANQLRQDLHVQRSQLPLPIAENVVIDLGPNFADSRNDSANKLMFVSVDGTYTWKHNEAVTTRGAVPFAIAQIVDRDNGGAWRAPSRAELAPLFAAQVESGETTTTYLNRVFKTEGRFAGQSFIWTSDTTKQQILYNYTCYTGCFGSYLDVTTYTGWDITGSRAEHKRQPAMPGGDRAWKDVRIAQQQRDAKWAETKGGVIATRNTGNRIYM